jgi:hypothetical protein
VAIARFARPLRWVGISSGRAVTELTDESI